MKARLTFKIPVREAEQAVKALSLEAQDTKRVSSKVTAKKGCLEILISAADLTSLRAATNTWIKMYETFNKMRESKCLKKPAMNRKGRIFLNTSSCSSNCRR